MKPSTKLPFDILIQFIEYCNSISESVVVVVEGKRDIDAIEAIGIKLVKGKILARKGTTLSRIVDQIYPFQVIILLLDFDKEGRHMWSGMKAELQKRKGHGIIDPYPRQLLYRFFRAVRINEQDFNFEKRLIIEELKQFSSVITGIEDRFNNE